MNDLALQLEGYRLTTAEFYVLHAGSSGLDPKFRVAV